MKRFILVLSAFMLMLCVCACDDTPSSSSAEKSLDEIIESVKIEAKKTYGDSSSVDVKSQMRESYKWVAKNVRYKNIAVDLSNGYTAELVDELAKYSFSYRNGSCEHVAATLYKLFESVGAEPIMVDGERLDSGTNEWGAHAWVIAKVDGKYYHFDPLFARNHTPDYMSMFMAKDSDIEATHKWDRKAYPVCD